MIKNTTIWKFSFPIKGQIQIEIPEGAEILSVQTQQRVATIWALCNPKANMVQRTFLIAGTGHEHNFENKKYIGTFQMSDGHLVWHLFETK